MRKKLILLILPAFFILLVASPVLAAVTNSTAPASSVHLTNPLSISTPQQLIGKIISALLGLVGSIALLMFVYGGFVWMTAAGNEKSVTKGRDILMWAAIGLVIIFISYAAVKFLIGEVIGA